MFKKTLIALLAIAGGASSISAMAAASNASCVPPVTKIMIVETSEEFESHFTVDCQVMEFLTVTPQVKFTGALIAPGTAPYLVKARYTIDVRDAHARKLDTLPRADQEISGNITSATDSVAGLGGQFAAQTVWDTAGVLSVEESKDHWRVFSLQGSETKDRVDGGASLLVEVGVVDAGMAHTAFKNGRATVKVDLGEKVSRFAEKSVEDQPSITAAMGLRAGKLELLQGATRVANHESVQNALLRLDRAPQDMARAWNLAARAQILGLNAEVRYAERKVAANNPQLFEEFQQNVRRIQPFNILVK